MQYLVQVNSCEHVRRVSLGGLHSSGPRAPMTQQIAANMFSPYIYTFCRVTLLNTTIFKKSVKALLQHPVLYWIVRDGMAGVLYRLMLFAHCKETAASFERLVRPRGCIIYYQVWYACSMSYYNNMENLRQGSGHLGTLLPR